MTFDWFKKTKQVASAPAPQADDGSAFFNALRESPAPIPPGYYPMWIQSAEEPSLTASGSLQAIDRLYSATAGIEEAVLALLLRQIGKVGADVGRVSLPEDTDVIALVTGDQQLFLVSLHQEKGIRLHFSPATPVPFRMMVLNRLAAYIEKRRSAMQDMVRRDGPGNCTGAQWWWMLKKTAIDVEAKAEPVEVIGQLGF